MSGNPHYGLTRVLWVKLGRCNFLEATDSCTHKKSLCSMSEGLGVLALFKYWPRHFFPRNSNICSLTIFVVQTIGWGLVFWIDVNVPENVSASKHSRHTRIPGTSYKYRLELTQTGKGIRRYLIRLSAVLLIFDSISALQSLTGSS